MLKCKNCGDMTPNNPEFQLQPDTIPMLISLWLDSREMDWGEWLEIRWSLILKGGLSQDLREALNHLISKYNHLPRDKSKIIYIYFLAVFKFTYQK